MGLIQTGGDEDAAGEDAGSPLGLSFLCVDSPRQLVNKASPKKSIWIGMRMRSEMWREVVVRRKLKKWRTFRIGANQSTRLGVTGKGTPMTGVIENSTEVHTDREMPVFDRLVREGAQRMLQQAREEEFKAYLERHAQARDERGHAQTRTITVGTGMIEVTAPRVIDKRVVDGKRWRARERTFYIGKWHFHPADHVEPSSDDFAQVIEISRAREHVCKEPLLLVLGAAKHEGQRIFRTFVCPSEKAPLELHRAGKEPSAASETGGSTR